MFIRDGNFLYFLGWCGYRLFFKTFYGIKAEGLEKIPETGGVIIASNHVSTLDPPAIGSVLKRAIYYMAKKELFGNPVFGWILHKVNAFPVSRSGADIHALRQAQRILEEGKILLIFPQGGRRSEGNVTSIKSGVGMLACHAHVPVVPCAVLSPKSVKGLNGIVIKFSDPVYFPEKCDKTAYEEFSAKIAGRIAEMLEK